MKDYVAENNRILNEWREKYVKENQHKYPKCPDIGVYFANDGIMNIGNNFYNDENGTVWRKASGKENIKWNECPLRVLFLTKDRH